MDLYSYFVFLRIRPFSDYKYFIEEIAKPLQAVMGAKAAFKRLHVSLLVTIPQSSDGTDPAFDAADTGPRHD